MSTSPIRKNASAGRVIVCLRIRTKGPAMVSRMTERQTVLFHWVEAPVTGKEREVQGLRLNMATQRTQPTMLLQLVLATILSRSLSTHLRQAAALKRRCCHQDLRVDKVRDPSPSKTSDPLQRYTRIQSKSRWRPHHLSSPRQGADFVSHFALRSLASGLNQCPMLNLRRLTKMLQMMDEQIAQIGAHQVTDARR